MTSPTHPIDIDVRNAGKLIALGVIGVAALFGLYVALGMPGMDHTATEHDMTSMTTIAFSGLRELDPATFEAAITAPDAEVINVHIPYEGEIARTDTFTAFDEIADSELPGDKDTAIVLYCRSGRMSTIAGNQLVALGYTNVSHLTGGMNAWTDSGRTVVNN